ncbi:phasin [Mesorhizobium captivum]|uniref:phasin n=1 Tax=Mesorhizobium captivum TaxID=3072319 RepID=UPI002A23B161|nr:phasin [Mesorhizobium sp. VK22E]MDX8505586.1 phasin [Mesorhizobium sp. VK22E]
MAKIPGKSETIENAESAFEPSMATEQVRAVAEQGVELSKEAFSKLESNVETTQKAFESTLEVAKTTRNEVSLKTIAALRANAEAGFAHLEALVAVKSPSEFFELQAAFVNKQIDVSIEQARTLQAVMLRAGEDASKPIKDAFEKALKDLKAA